MVHSLQHHSLKNTQSGESKAIAYLEKPKGCLKTLRLLDRKGEITIRELMRETSLSQNGAYSSLDHLAGLGVVESPTESTIRGASKKYKPTRKGEELLRLVSVFFNLLELVSRRENIDPYLETPYRSWEILLRTYRDGRVSLTKSQKCLRNSRHRYGISANVGKIVF